MSWRNPDAEHGHFDFDTYAQAVLEARDAAARDRRRDAVNVIGGLLGRDHHRRARSATWPTRAGSARSPSLTLLVCALDNAQAGTAEALASEPIAAAAVAESARRGYLDGRGAGQRVRLAAPERPDLELRGQQLPAGQGAAGVRHPLLEPGHRPHDGRAAPRLRRHGARQRARHAGRRCACSARRSTSAQVDVDTYIVAGLATTTSSHWRNAYRSTQLLGGDSRFVLSTSGHIQALINPPTVRTAGSSYRIADDQPARASPTGRRRPSTHRGSWWPDYIAWLQTRVGRAGAGAEEARQPRPQGDGEGAGHVRAWRHDASPMPRRPLVGRPPRRDALDARGGAA